jgi:putative redox protein
MVKSTAIYQGGLHCELTHGPSQSHVETDAPTDNNGKGERFSPTDLIGGALTSCILTTMAIVADRDGVDLRGTTAEVEKHMVLNPRRIGRLPVKIFFPKGIAKDYRRKLENTANVCPVHASLHPDIESPIEFIYPD